jgi:hypothetical protein
MTQSQAFFGLKEILEDHPKSPEILLPLTTPCGGDSKESLFLSGPAKVSVQSSKKILTGLQKKRF